MHKDLQLFLQSKYIILLIIYVNFDTKLQKYKKQQNAHYTMQCYILYSFLYTKQKTYFYKLNT